MSIYSKKKRIFTLKRFLFFFTLFILIYILFYFIYFRQTLPNYNLDKIDTNSLLLEDRQNEYVTLNNLDNLFKDFIMSNPEIIIKSVEQFNLEKHDYKNTKDKKISLENIKSNMFVGSANSNKIIYEFIDYNCGYCLKFHQVLNQTISLIPDLQVQIIQMPMLSSNSEVLSRIAIAASFQGDFNSTHDYLFSESRRSSLDEIFADLFLLDINIKTIKANMNSVSVDAIIDSHKKEFFNFNFRGTPAIIIGKEIIPGFIDKDKLIQIINDQFS